MATITFDLTAEQTQRVAAAVGNILGLVDGQNDPRPATPQECRSYIILMLKTFVLKYERDERLRNAPNDIPFEVP